jgi:hypothetical protein
MSLLCTSGLLLHVKIMSVEYSLIGVEAINYQELFWMFIFDFVSGPYWVCQGPKQAISSTIFNFFPWLCVIQICNKFSMIAWNCFGFILLGRSTRRFYFLQGAFIIFIGKVPIFEQSVHGGNCTSTSVFYHLGNKRIEITPHKVMYRESCYTGIILDPRKAALFGKFIVFYITV